MAPRRGSGPEGARDPLADRGDARRIDVGRVVAGDLRHRAPRARHDRAAAGERLGDRDAVALVERRVDEAARAAVERGELLVADLAEPGRRSAAARRRPSRARRRRAARRRPPRRSAPGSCVARASRRRACSRPAARGPSGVKTSSTAFGTTRIFVLGTREQLVELARGELRDGDHPRGGADDARHGAARVRARPAVEPLRPAQHREVVHGDDERDARRERAAEGRAVQDVGAVRPAGAGTRATSAATERSREVAGNDVSLTGTSRFASSPRRYRAVPARVCCSGVVSIPTRIAGTPRGRARRCAARRSRAACASPSARSSSRRPSASRIAVGHRLRRSPGRSARPRRPQASSSDGCDEATTGAPQAIASVIGIPKPSKRDG